nr:hypothetical protein [Tanacetum cinerariifolium]
MAAPRPANIVARRVTDDLIAFSGETAVPRYMKFFLVQKIAECRRFVNQMRDEVETVRAPGPANIVARRVTDDLIAFSGETAVPRYMKFFLVQKIAESRPMEDQDEVRDSLLAAKDAKHGEEIKLLALNDVIAEALDDTDTQEVNVKILDDENNGV